MQQQKIILEETDIEEQYLDVTQQQNRNVKKWVDK